MKISILGVVALSATAIAGAQTATPAKDSDLPGLTTPTILDKDKGQVGLQINTFGGSDNLFRTGVSLGYGLGNNLQAILAGTFAKNDTFGLAGGGSINYGGSAGDFILKFGMPGSYQSSFQIGIGYSQTPAQDKRAEGLVGVSAGTNIGDGFRIYVNPKFVALNDNSLFGVSVGAIVDISSGISLYGDWTPLFDGDNTLSTADGSPNRQSLYAVGFRFAKLTPGLSIDVAYTNMVGATSGFSLTPSLGNTGGLYVGLTYGF